MITLVHTWYDKYNNKMFYAYEVEKERFYNNEKVSKLICAAFAHYYQIEREAANEIVENFDLWEDEGLLEELLDNFMEEVDEIFWEEDFGHPDNEYKKDGAC